MRPSSARTHRGRPDPPRPHPEDLHDRDEHHPGRGLDRGQPLRLFKLACLRRRLHPREHLHLHRPDRPVRLHRRRGRIVDPNTTATSCMLYLMRNGTCNVPVPMEMLSSGDFRHLVGRCVGNGHLGLRLPHQPPPETWMLLRPRSRLPRPVVENGTTR